ncbi:MAG: ATP--guanido phosphotransferase [Clostridia bacterium]|nr:ATP--guanido phosphotransferase [Clostridia bacterium]
MWWKQVSNDSDVVVSTRIRYARNLSGYNFPNHITKSDSLKLIDSINMVLDKKEYKLFKMADIDEITRHSLIEQHIISKEFADNVETGAIVSNNDNTLVAMVNEEDHLRIQAFESGLNIENCYNKLSSFTNKLEEKLSFASNDDYGYLTACPTNVGSGMRVSVMVHLPALARLGYLTKILEEASSMGVAVRGLYGENTTGDGNMFQISNQKNFGESEESTMIKIKDVVYSIVIQERKARNILLENSIQIEDEIYRTYGVLKNARLVSNEESIKLLSKLRLGVAMGIIKNVSLDKVQGLIINSNTNMLKTILKQDMSEYEENIKRAEYIRREID